MMTKPPCDALVKPATTHAGEISLALQALACIRHNGPTIYVAAPITGGPRFVDWFKADGRNYQQDRERFLSELRVAVIEPNSRSAAELIRDLGRARDATFVDPSTLLVESWTQDDYRYFWSRVIEVFAEEAIFLDGWHLSSGCAFEFLVASEKGIPVFAQSVKRIDFEVGLKLVEEGFSILTSVGAETLFFESVLVEIRKFARRRAK